MSRSEQATNKQNASRGRDLRAVSGSSVRSITDLRGTSDITVSGQHLRQLDKLPKKPETENR